jgi:hypothetical protein
VTLDGELHMRAAVEVSTFKPAEWLAQYAVTRP